MPRYLLRRAGTVILVAALVTTVAGWQFKAIAKATYPKTDELVVVGGANLRVSPPPISGER